MRVRPLITCFMSEIETFLCFLTTGLIFTVLIIIECTSGFYIRVRVVIIYFYIRCYHVCISDSVYSFYYQV